MYSVQPKETVNFLIVYMHADNDIAFTVYGRAIWTLNFIEACRCFEKIHKMMRKKMGEYFSLVANSCSIIVRKYFYGIFTGSARSRVTSLSRPVAQAKR